ITATTPTSRRDPGKDRSPGEGTRADHRWPQLNRTERRCSEKRQDERGGKSQNLSGDEGPLGEKKRKKAPLREIGAGRKCSYAGGRQGRQSGPEGSIERADSPGPEGGRKTWGDGEGVGGGAWKELRQHQCLVPHHGQGSEGYQEGCAGQICVGALRRLCQTSLAVAFSKIP